MKQMQCHVTDCDEDADNMSIYLRLQERNKSLMSSNPRQHIIEDISSNSSSGEATSNGSDTPQPQGVLKVTRSFMYREQNEMAANNIRQYIKQRKNLRTSGEPRDDVSVSTATPVNITPPPPPVAAVKQKQLTANEDKRDQDNGRSYSNRSSSQSQDVNRHQREKQRKQRVSSSTLPPKERRGSTCSQRSNAKVKAASSNGAENDVKHKNDRPMQEIDEAKSNNNLDDKRRVRSSQKKLPRKTSESPSRDAQSIKEQIAAELFERIRKKNEASSSDSSSSTRTSVSTNKSAGTNSSASICVGSGKAGSKTPSPGSTLMVGAPRFSPAVTPSPQGTIIVGGGGGGSYLAVPLRSDLSATGPTSMSTTLLPEEAEQRNKFEDENRKSQRRDTERKKMQSDASKSTRRSSITKNITPPKKRTDTPPKNNAPMSRKTVSPPQLTLSPATLQRKNKRWESPGAASSASSNSQQCGRRRSVSPAVQAGIADLAHRAMERDGRILALQRRKEKENSQGDLGIKDGQQSSARPSSPRSTPNSSIRPVSPQPMSKLQRNMAIFRRKVNEMLSGAERLKKRTSDGAPEVPREAAPPRPRTPTRDGSPAKRRSIDKVVVGLSPYADKTSDMRAKVPKTSSVGWAKLRDKYLNRSREREPAVACPVTPPSLRRSRTPSYQSRNNWQSAFRCGVFNSNIKPTSNYSYSYVSSTAQLTMIQRATSSRRLNMLRK